MSITRLKVRLYGDPCLKKKSQPVKEVGPGERLLIRSMLVTMHEEKGVGLAAPQVGVNSRIFVADIGEGPMAFINPKIVRKSGSVVMEEGCLSIPEVQVNVKRAQAVTVRYMDENGRPQEKAFFDLMARVVQHENDHLDGKLITDYANRTEKQAFKEQLKKLEELSKV